MSTVKIAALTQWGDNGWNFHLEEVDEEDNLVSREYRTTTSGEGLYRWEGSSWEQLRGNADWNLPRDRKAALRKIRKTFS